MKLMVFWDEGRVCMSLGLNEKRTYRNYGCFLMMGFQWVSQSDGARPRTIGLESELTCSLKHEMFLLLKSPYAFRVHSQLFHEAHVRVRCYQILCARSEIHSPSKGLWPEQVRS